MSSAIKERTDEEAVLEWVMHSAREKAESGHHRVPQFYLRQFVAPDGKLRLLDPRSGVVRRVARKDAFVLDGYYTTETDDSERLALAEVAYADIEDRAARPYRALLEGTSPADLTDKQRSYLALLLAIQITRGERFATFNARVTETLGRSTLDLRALHIESWWDRFCADQQQAGEPVEISRERFVEFIGRGEFTISPTAEATIEMRIAMVRELAEILVSFNWHVIHFRTPCLFSCEEPLSYWVPPERRLPERGIGLINSDEIRFPLSPAAALILTHPGLDLPEAAGRGSERAAAWINYWTFAFNVGQTLILAGEGNRHALPVSELLPSVFKHPFPAGPIIDR